MENYNGDRGRGWLPRAGRERIDRVRVRDRHAAADRVRVRQGRSCATARIRSSTSREGARTTTRHHARRGPGPHRRAGQRCLQPRPVEAPRRDRDDVTSSTTASTRGGSTSKGYGETQPGRPAPHAGRVQEEPPRRVHHQEARPHSLGRALIGIQLVELDAHLHGLIVVIEIEVDRKHAVAPAREEQAASARRRPRSCRHRACSCAPRRARRSDASADESRSRAATCSRP